MKTCSKCGYGNKDEAKFCGACGNKLEPPAPAAPVEQLPPEITCPVCGSKNRAGVHYCGQCGVDLSKIGQVAPPPDVPEPGPVAIPGASLAAAQPEPAAGTTSPNLVASAEAPVPAEPIEPPRPGSGPAQPEAPAEPVPAPPAVDAVVEQPPEDVSGTPPDEPALVILPAPEPIALAPEVADETKPAAACGHCGAVIRYCPCCGKPLVA